MGGNLKGAPHALNSQTPNIYSPTNPSLMAKILSWYLPLVGYSHKSSKEEEEKTRLGRIKILKYVKSNV